VILGRIEECLEIDPGGLFEENRDLLYADFELLATGVAKDKLAWITEMDLAMEAAEHVANGFSQALRTCLCAGIDPHPQV
jgi:hypothetical protein